VNCNSPILSRTNLPVLKWSTEVSGVLNPTHFERERNEEGSEGCVDARLEYERDGPEQVDDSNDPGNKDLC